MLLERINLDANTLTRDYADYAPRIGYPQPLHRAVIEATASLTNVSGGGDPNGNPGSPGTPLVAVPAGKFRIRVFLGVNEIYNRFLDFDTTHPVFVVNPFREVFDLNGILWRSGEQFSVLLDNISGLVAGFYPISVELYAADYR